MWQRKREIMQLKLVPTKNIHHKNSFDDKHIIFIPPKALEKGKISKSDWHFQ
jgi:hypothetical protein